jgi:hypothetical protein
VVFDFLEKLRELEMSGDANAAKLLNDFENARNQGNWKTSLDFERNVIKTARDQFDLLSPLEALDLERLSEDRNRSAHPSEAATGEPYQPTAELARAHIRNAITHLLSHPPAQGKAALKRLVENVESDYFPTDPNKAAEHFKSGPLARSRDALVRNFIIVLAKTILWEQAKTQERSRRFAALNAVRSLHPNVTEAVLVDVMPGIIDSVKDEKWYRVLFFLARVPDSWDLVGRAAQIKALEYVEKADPEDLRNVLVHGTRIPELRSITNTRLRDATTEILLSVLKYERPAPYVDEAISRFEKAKGFRNAEALLDGLVLPLATSLEARHIERICDAFLANPQIRLAIAVPSHLIRLLNATENLAESARPSWQKVYAASIEEGDAYPTETPLRKALEKRFNFNVAI